MLNEMGLIMAGVTLKPCSHSSAGSDSEVITEQRAEKHCRSPGRRSEEHGKTSRKEHFIFGFEDWLRLSDYHRAS